MLQENLAVSAPNGPLGQEESALGKEEDLSRAPPALEEAVRRCSLAEREALRGLKTQTAGTEPVEELRATGQPAQFCRLYWAELRGARHPCF